MGEGCSQDLHGEITRLLQKNAADLGSSQVTFLSLVLFKELLCFVHRADRKTSRGSTPRMQQVDSWVWQPPA